MLGPKQYQAYLAALRAVAVLGYNRGIPTQFKATQLVVAIAVWANAISARGAHPNLSILLLNNASEQYYITIG